MPEPRAPFRPPDPPTDPVPPGRPLGHWLAFALVALVVMVALGVFWVWQRSAREQRWRDQINAAEPFTAPPPTR